MNNNTKKTNGENKLIISPIKSSPKAGKGFFNKTYDRLKITDTISIIRAIFSSFFAKIN